MTPKEIHELGASALAVLAVLRVKPSAKPAAIALEVGIGNHAVYDAFRKLHGKNLLPGGCAYRPYPRKKNT